MTGSRPVLTLLPALTLVTTIVFVALAPRPAHACSCAEQDPEVAVAEADAAFVGTLVGRDGDRWGFDVEAVVAGELSTPLTLRVESGDTSSCGIVPNPGQRYGLVTYREPDGVLTSNLCGQYDPDELLAAGEPREPVPASDDPTDPDAAAGGSVGAGVGAGPAIVAGTVLGSLAVLGGAVLWARRRPTDG